MTHEELLAKIDYYLEPTEKLTGDDRVRNSAIGFMKSLRAVVELCAKWDKKGSYCLPIQDVIKAIEKELG